MKRLLSIAAWMACFAAAAHAQAFRAEVKQAAGVPALFINGEPCAPYAYMSYFGEAKYYREAAAAGIHLYNIPAYLGDRGINSASGIGPFRPAIWKGNGEYDLSGVEKEMEELVQADPDAKMIVRIHLDPPLWWERENPDAVSLQPNGSGFRTSTASKKWKQQAGDALRVLVQRLQQSPNGRHLVGIHVAGASTEEWLYHFKDLFYDGSEDRKTAFRQWLREHYGGSRAALRKAWGDRQVTFGNATPADISGAEKRSAWRHDARFINTFQFHSELMAGLIAYFCGIVKSASNGRLLTGAFYGYHLFVNDARRGHSALWKLLQCKDLDYLSSPNDYNRVAGEDWAPMAAIRSVQLHGKLWLAENDTRTFRTKLLRDRAPEVEPPGDWYSKGVWIGPKDPALSVSLLRKNLARMLAYGYGGWWFDMWGGWFSDARLMAVLRMGQQFFAQYPSTESPQMRPQVAVITDERLQDRDGSFGALTGAITGNRYALGRCGAPYDLFLRGDADSVRTGYKAVWLLGVMDVTATERRLLRAWLAGGMTVLHTGGANSTLYTPGGTTKHFPGKVKWTAAELGALWEQAGAHRYLQTDDVLYAGRGWLAVHSLQGGEKTLRLPAAANITDPETGEVAAKDARQWQATVEPGGTKLWRVDFTR